MDIERVRRLAMRLLRRTSVLYGLNRWFSTLRSLDLVGVFGEPSPVLVSAKRTLFFGMINVLRYSAGRNVRANNCCVN